MVKEGVGKGKYIIILKEKVVAYLKTTFGYST
jgi:hypothetical protein